MPLELDEEQRGRADRFDRWLFLCVWLFPVLTQDNADQPVRTYAPLHRCKDPLQSSD